MVKATLLEAQPRQVHARPAATLVIAASPRARLAVYESGKVRGEKHQVMNLGVGVSGRPKP
jgi:hypothetical protein